MYLYNYLVIVAALLLCLILNALSHQKNNHAEATDIQTSLSNKFKDFILPSPYEDNFNRMIKSQYRKNHEDVSEDVLKSETNEDISARDFQTVLRHIQGIFMFSEDKSFELDEKIKKEASLRGVSNFEKCAADVNTMLAAVRNETQWAVRMLDAWGKPGPGITDRLTSLIFPGQFDQCLQTNIPGEDFSSQFCFEGVGLTKVGPITFKKPFGFYLATCIPSTCTADEFGTFLTIYLSLQPDISGGAGNGQCIDPKPPLSNKAIAVIVVLSIFAFLMIAATLYDVLVVQKYWSTMFSSRSGVNTLGLEQSTSEDGGTEQGLYEPLLNSQVDKKKFEPNVAERALLCFSVYTNGSKVLSTKTGAGSIDCIHGIRFLSMCWVVLGHSFSTGLSLTENTNNYMDVAYSRWTFQAILNALVSVDTFFTLSGLLMTYLVLKELTKKPPSGGFFFNFYFHRFWRLTPPYMLVMMVYICLLHYTGDGPFWPSKGFEPDDCKNNWWANLLYINNLHKYNDKQMCMGWSWYLSNDMQFYIISPAIFLVMYYFGWWGLILPSAMILGSAITSGVLSSENDLQANFDLRRSQGDYFDVYYIKPYCRIGPYLVGMITGYILHRTDCKVYMSKFVVILGWAIAWAVGLAVVYGLFENTNGHPISTEVAALYNALDRIAWGAAVCWVIFACATGYGGFINTLLSWKGLVPLSRLTYSTYLVHYMVVLYFFYSQRRFFYLDTTNVVIAFLGILVLSMLVAFAASMAFEAPFMGLEKILVPGVKSAGKWINSKFIMRSRYTKI